MRRGSSGSSTVSTLDIEILSAPDRKVCGESRAILDAPCPWLSNPANRELSDPEQPNLFDESSRILFWHPRCYLVRCDSAGITHDTYSGLRPREIGENSGRLACDSVDGSDGFRSRSARLRAGKRSTRSGCGDDARRRGDGGAHRGRSAPESPDAG